MRRYTLALVALCAAGLVPAVGSAQPISCVRGDLQRAVNLYIDAQTHFGSQVHNGVHAPKGRVERFGVPHVGFYDLGVQRR